MRRRLLLLFTLALPTALLFAAGYPDGQRALDDGRWAEAATIFREVAQTGGDDADGALYWQAYALAKDGEKAEALAVLRLLPSRHPESEWLDDARVLELELRGPKTAATGDATEDDELKLYALNGLLHAEPERALPVLRKFLAGDASPRLKKQALFVLGQSGSPESRALLESVATGRQHPELQTEAIAMLGITGDAGSLSRIYGESRDPEVRRAVLQAYLVADAEAEVVAIARGDDDPEMRRQAIQQLGAMEAETALRELYAERGSVETKRAVLMAMGIAGDADALARAARSEADAGLRRDAIRGLAIVDTPAAGAALEEIYASGNDLETREAVVEALFIRDDAETLIRLFRAERDPDVRRAIVQKLSLMDSPESTQVLLDLLDP